MPRPRRDGTPAQQPNRHNLTDMLVSSIKPQAAAFTVWDQKQKGLALLVQPTGHKAFKVVYRNTRGPRWFHIGDARAIGLADARRIAAETMLKAILGDDPHADRMAQRGANTFAELASKYLEQHAKKHNKSWKQADRLIRSHVLPRWGKLQATAIARADVKALMASFTAPILANQTLAAVSAIFTWGIKEEIVTENPCKLVERNKTQDRERVLSESEMPVLWRALDALDDPVRSAALKTILLTGQRPGEVASMRREHIVDGWWTMPGAPVPALRWPGTKNGQTHRVWLPAKVVELIEEFGGDGFVFTNGKQAICNLDDAMRALCSKFSIERLTPHDLRRTHGSTVTALGFGRDAMNRIQNHKEGGIADVYDRHEYKAENQNVMERVAARLLALAEGNSGDERKVVPFSR